MRKILTGAAIAATLSFTLAPATATAPVAAARQDAVSISLPDVADKAAPADAEAGHGLDVPKVAPGQERADFHAWLARAPGNRAAVRAFRAHLEANGVEDVVPIWTLVRTSSSWRDCGAGQFEVAPRDKWDNIVRTLKFVERDVVPSVGPVQVVSGYRNQQLNACSNGAPASAHRHFFALDLMPIDADVSRGELVRDVCRAHARDGRAYNTGLGFYSGLRFHVDSNGFRKWGANGSGATSPCVTQA
jgi:hypothetical protein